MPLNPKLYSLLQQRFGDVKVSHAGETAKGSYRTDPITGRIKHEVDKTHRGEQYSVNCPFCPDTRHRLSFNYRWGVYDDVTDSYNYHLFHCYNEDCEKTYSRRKGTISGAAIWAYE
jgi:hypothetical protein